MPQSRQLAAIMFTDIVGYTALMGNDEQKAFEYLKKNRAIQKPIIEQYHGRWIKELGDGVMASFNTVSDAVNAAIKIQEACTLANDFQLRIGIHQGEVVFEQDDVFGDAVNIAARIQAAAKPGTIYVSESVHNNVANKKENSTRFIREEVLKNVKEPVRIYEVFLSNQENQNNRSSSEKPPAKTQAEKSIAVLPFVDMSPDRDQEHLGDGIAEEIINSLVHLKDLNVAGRTSAFQFKGKNIDLREIGEKLKVKTILEGSIRKQGNKIRITAQLINIEDGYHIWSERYDRELDDIFAIQDEIALSITEKLKVALLVSERELITKLYTQDTEAYQLYLQGRYNWNRRNEEGLEASVKYFKKAIGKDPGYALAWAGLADSYNLLGEFGRLSRKESFSNAKEAANKALELDSHLAEAHISLASLLFLYEWDWANSGKEFRLGIELNPNYATGHQWYSEWLVHMGRFEEAIKEISQAVKLDPVSLGILKDKGIVLYYSREYGKALELAMGLLKLDSNFPAVHRLLSLIYQAKGMFDLAFAHNRLWGIITGNHYKTTISLAQLYAVSERKEEAIKLIESLDEEEILHGNDYRGLALVYIALGDKDKAFENLEKSYKSHEVSLISLKVDPKLDPIRHDPRFAAFLARMNFPG